MCSAHVQEAKGPFIVEEEEVGHRIIDSLHHPAGSTVHSSGGVSVKMKQNDLPKVQLVSDLQLSSADPMTLDWLSLFTVL